MVDQLFSLLSRPCSISSAAYLYPVDGGIARYSRQVQRAISVENRPAGGCDERTTSWKTEQMSSCLNSRPVSPLFSTGCCCVSCCPFFLSSTSFLLLSFIIFCPHVLLSPFRFIISMCHVPVLVIFIIRSANFGAAAAERSSGSSGHRAAFSDSATKAPDSSATANCCQRVPMAPFGCWWLSLSASYSSSSSTSSLCWPPFPSIFFRIEMRFLVKRTTSALLAARLSSGCNQRICFQAVPTLAPLEGSLDWRCASVGVCQDSRNLISSFISFSFADLFSRRGSPAGLFHCHRPPESKTNGCAARQIADGESAAGE